MAGIIRSRINGKRNILPFIGVQVLESLTTGMYDDPLIIYREYIQNSVDAIDNAIAQGIMVFSEACIKVKISGRDRVITIEDNGTGVAPNKAPNILGDIGNSIKYPKDIKYIDY